MKNNQDYIVRCDRAGVFFGKIKERNGSEVTMTEVRKLWNWDGACAVEQLAQASGSLPLFLKMIKGQFLQISAPGKGSPGRVMDADPDLAMRSIRRSTVSPM